MFAAQYEIPFYSTDICNEWYEFIVYFKLLSTPLTAVDANQWSHIYIENISSVCLSVCLSLRPDKL